MLNHAVIMGRMVRDPEVKQTQSGFSVCSFSVAVDRDIADKSTGKKETDFINVTAWRNTADFIGKYFSKGSLIVVDGRIQVRNYNDKDGNTRVTTEIVAQNVYFGGSKKKDGDSADASAPLPSPVPDPDPEGDLPF